MYEFPNILLRPGIFSLYLGIMRPQRLGRPFDIWDGAGDGVLVTAVDLVGPGDFTEGYDDGLVSLPFRVQHHVRAVSHGSAPYV